MAVTLLILPLLDTRPFNHTRADAVFLACTLVLEVDAAAFVFDLVDFAHLGGWVRDWIESRWGY